MFKSSFCSSPYISKGSACKRSLWKYKRTEAVSSCIYIPISRLCNAGDITVCTVSFDVLYRFAHLYNFFCFLFSFVFKVIINTFGNSIRGSVISENYSINAYTKISSNKSYCLKFRIACMEKESGRPGTGVR